MKNHLWKLVGAVALLAMLIAAVPLAAEEPAAGPINRLRVYGKRFEFTKFPYEEYTEPFDLTSDAAPPKDFVQFNPAILFEGRYVSELGEFLDGDPLGSYITCGENAAEKVHARMWYDPLYPEPFGATYPEVKSKSWTADIVFEYTYTMLDDDTLNPTLCEACQTQLVFPMVGGVAPGFPNEQIGLEGYDVNNDGHDEVLKVERIMTDGRPDTQSTIVVSPKDTSGSLRLKKGDVVEFFDYALKVIDAPTTFDLKVEVAIYYTGYRHNEWKYIGQAGMYMGDFAAVDARFGPVRISSSPEVWKFPQPVIRPWFIEATYVGTDFVEVKPYRYLTAGESFFVDGAEYDVAAIYTEGQPCSDNPLAEKKGGIEWTDCCMERRFKYITLRNPLPKGTGEVRINDMSVLKKRVPANTSLPMLPPFNMEHDEVDDTNIPTWFDTLWAEGRTNYCDFSDLQLPDNMSNSADRKCGNSTADETAYVDWSTCKIEFAPGADGYGDCTFLPYEYNSIWERVMLNTAPYDGLTGDPNSFIAWTEQTKEGRFDTNLMEEKFTEEFWPGGCMPIEEYKYEELTEKKEWDGLWYYGITSETPLDVNAPVGLGPEDVHVYVNGVKVPVIEVNEADANPGQYYVALEQNFPDANEGPNPDTEIFIGYYYETCIEVDRGNWEAWQWINIETWPWHYTEFILPLRPDITDDANEDGDYILVSSWTTQEDSRMKFVYDAAVGKIHSADIYVNDAEYNLEFRGVDANSLRVYGRCIEDARFPYTRFDGPFNIGNENNEKPEKDFIVHNPAYMNHWDSELFGHIKADADADQKVHLRTWYVPKYYEPAGDTMPPVRDPVSNFDVHGHGDIVNEYTYLLLDDATQNPTFGSKERTQLVFPMAGLGGQVGLDRYDVNGDGTDEIMQVMRVKDRNTGSEYCQAPTPQGEIIVSPQAIDAGNMQLNVGGMIEFFDYAIELIDTSTAETKALFDVWYIGRGYDQKRKVGSVWLFNGPWGLVNNTAIVEAGEPASVYGVSYWDHPYDLISEELEAVVKPFGFLLDHVSTNYVSVKPFRVLTAGESFFVDGAEYDVAAIGVVPGEQVSEAHGEYLCGLKYITIRNPIPKCDPLDNCDDLFVPTISVFKTRFGPGEILPVLPPFNHMHDRVDDVNIPEYGSGPDVQRFDNLPICQDEPWKCFYPYNPLDFWNPIDEFPAGSGLYWGVDSLIHELFNTIAERVVPDVDPLEFYWLAEEKEERFDTSLTEEKWKFTEANDEVWKWINIETLPWDFTEFVLPDIPEAGVLEDLGVVGDYILVSSFVTQDDVRVKFSYDPSDGTGLYVNSDLCEPARVTSLTSNSPVEQYATIELFGAVVNADDFAWDFGDLTGCTGEDTLEPTCPGNVAGEFEVKLTAMNECGQHTAVTTVVVKPCLGDFEPPFGFRDLADIMKMLPYWNLRCGDPGYDEMFDINGDCRIGLADIMQVVEVWNTECPGGTP